MAKHEQDLEIVVEEALSVDAAVTAPYLLTCNTPEFYNNDEEVDCENAKE